MIYNDYDPCNLCKKGKEKKGLRGNRQKAEEMAIPPRAHQTHTWIGGKKKGLKMAQ